jgi:hypothetical protein
VAQRRGTKRPIPLRGALEHLVVMLPFHHLVWRHDSCRDGMTAGCVGRGTRRAWAPDRAYQSGLRRSQRTDGRACRPSASSPHREPERQREPAAVWARLPAGLIARAPAHARRHPAHLG